MKVCIYSYYFYPIIGGLQVFTKGLAEFLTKNGYEVTLITETIKKEDVEDNYDFEIIRKSSIKQLYSIISNSSIIHLNGFSLKVVLITLLLRKGIIWTHHEFDSICPIGIGWNGSSSCTYRFFQCIRCMKNKGMASSIPKRFVSLFLRRITGHLVECNVNTTFYFSERQNLPNSIVIPIPIDLSMFKPVDSNWDERYFLFLGRLIEIKGVEILIQALSKCVLQGYPIRIMVCGNGPDRARLSMISKTLDMENNIFFEDYKYGNDLVETINNSLAVVVPSLWDEPFGIVALEALSCGKVVIASDVGGLAELVSPAGLLFERGNVDDLAAKMITLYKNKKLRKLMEHRARLYAQNYNCELVGQRYIKCFDLVLKDSN